jgi:hypothetical protein
MKRLLVIATLATLGSRGPADACELAYRTAFPTPEAVRLSGTVVGYVQIPGVPAVKLSPMSAGWQATVSGLRVAVREIVSGPVSGTEAIVALFPHTTDCMSIAATRETLERDYPIGSMLAVRGRATGSPDVPVIAETNTFEFVVTIPNDLPRLAQGDLDYRMLDATVRSRIIEFEFDRAILAFARRRGNEYERLRNLALPRVWDGMPDARALYGQLVEKSGLGARERADLLDQFQQWHPRSK